MGVTRGDRGVCLSVPIRWNRSGTAGPGEPQPRGGGGSFRDKTTRESRDPPGGLAWESAHSSHEDEHAASLHRELGGPRQPSDQQQLPAPSNPASPSPVRPHGAPLSAGCGVTRRRTGREDVGTAQGRHGQPMGGVGQLEGTMRTVQRGHGDSSGLRWEHGGGGGGGVALRASGGRWGDASGRDQRWGHSLASPAAPRSPRPGTPVT